MSRLVGVLAVLLVLFTAMGLAVANVGHRVTFSLGFIVFYQVPVTLVAFSGLFVGMLVMFATGVHSDLKVRRILRERLAEDARREQTWIDRNQRDLFAGGAEDESDPGDKSEPGVGPDCGDESDSGEESDSTIGPDSGVGPDDGEDTPDRGASKNPSESTPAADDQTLNE